MWKKTNKPWNKLINAHFIWLYHMEALWGLDTAGDKLWGSPSCRTSPARLPPHSRSRSTRACACPPAAASASWASAWRSWPFLPSPSRPRSAAKHCRRAKVKLGSLGQRMLGLDWGKRRFSPSAARRGTQSSCPPRSCRTFFCCPRSGGCS